VSKNSNIIPRFITDFLVFFIALYEYLIMVAYEIPCMQLLLFLTQGKCVGKAIDVIMFHKLGRGMGVAAAR